MTPTELAQAAKTPWAPKDPDEESGTGASRHSLFSPRILRRLGGPGAVAAALGPAAIVLAWAKLWHPAVVDDAFISFRYARHWAQGLGLTFNPGDPPVEGYTNFLWTALAALGLRLGASPVALMPLIGTLCAAATCAVLALAMRRLAPRAPALWWALPGLLVAANPLWALWAVSGLETPLAALCITGGVCSALARRGRAEWTTALWFLAAALTRPDAVLWAGVMGLWCLRVDWRRALARFALPFALAAGAYWLWRWRYFGAFWPNTFAAKSGGRLPLLVLGGREFARGMLHSAAVALPFLRVLVGMGTSRRRPPGLGAPGLWAAAGAVGLHLAHLIWVGGDAFPGDRFLMPALPTMALLAFWIPSCDRARSPTEPWIQGLVLGALVVLLPLPAALRAHRQTEIAQWRWTCVGQWLDAHAPPGTRVALNPIGAIGFHAADCVIVDMLGLTDPVIAHGPVRDPWLPPGHRKGSGERVLALAPDIILINNVWLQPARMTGWTPLYASEADLFGRRRELLETFELVNWPVPRSEWPADLPLRGLPEEVDTLWLGALARRGVGIEPGPRGAAEARRG